MALPPSVMKNTIAAVAANLASTSKEAARALPLAKGGETPLALQAYRTEVYSYFTSASGQTELIYSAENWVRIKLTLETAGPVSVGTSAELSPVLGGRGRLLDTAVEFEVYLARGSRFYVISDSINRLSVTIEPVPWLEQLAGDMVTALSSVAQTVANIGAGIVNAVRATRPATSSSGNTAADLPCPPPPRGLFPRLTSLSKPKRTR